MAQLIGLARLGRDAELRSTQDGTPVASLSLAMDYRAGREKETQWVDDAATPMDVGSNAVLGPALGREDDAWRCIAPLCEPLGCVQCNCAVPADVYAVLMRAERATDFAWTAEDQAAVDADTHCAWTQENDEGSDTWATACGHLFCVTEGAPAENGMRFCCYCGKALQEHAFLHEGDDGA